MNKLKFSKICNLISTILILIFLIKTIIDYINYSTILTSAPFYVFIIVNTIYFLIPSLIIFIIGIIIKKKK